MNYVNLQSKGLKFFAIAAAIGMTFCGTMSPVMAEEPVTNTADASEETTSTYRDFNENEQAVIDEFCAIYSNDLKNANGVTIENKYIIRYLDCNVLGSRFMDHEHGFGPEIVEPAKQNLQNILDYISTMHSPKLFSIEYPEETEILTQKFKDFWGIFDTDLDVLYDYYNTAYFKYTWENGGFAYDYLGGVRPGEWTFDEEDVTYPPKLNEWLIERANNNQKDLKFRMEQPYTIDESTIRIMQEQDIHPTFYARNENNYYTKYAFTEGIKEVKPLTLGITFSKDMVKELDDPQAIAISFAHDGTLPGPMTVSVVDAQLAGIQDQELSLYWLNPETDLLEEQPLNATYEDGCVTFTISHCSTYIVATKGKQYTTLHKQNNTEINHDNSNEINNTNTVKPTEPTETINKTEPTINTNKTVANKVDSPIKPTSAESTKNMLVIISIIFVATGGYWIVKRKQFLNQKH